MTTKVSWNVASAAIALVATSLPATTLASVSCTINGGVLLQSMDAYYCDPDVSGVSCTGWVETDLDDTTVALKNLAVEVWQGSTCYAGDGVGCPGTGKHTNDSGGWSAAVTLPGSSCVGQIVELRFVWKRVHEDDRGTSGARYRFRLAAYSSNPWSGTDPTWYTTSNLTLTGSSDSYVTTFDDTPGNSNPSLATRLANVYYTAESAISQIIQWTSNLSTEFAATSEGVAGILRIFYDPALRTSTTSSTSDSNGWFVELGYPNYSKGAITRHELGHMVHYAVHDREMHLEDPGDPVPTGEQHCYSQQKLGASSASSTSCEHGYVALFEGFATFVAARSIYTSNTAGNLFTCTCSQSDNTDQDLCSDLVSAGASDADKITGCSGSVIGAFRGIGDDYANGQGDCARLQKNEGCCGGSGSGTCADSYWKTAGWQNTVDMARYFWDLIDGAAESGDDEDLSMTALMAALEGMPCSPSVFASDGSCNEPHRSDPTDCVDEDPTDTPTANTNGTRDAYNAWDVDQRISGSQGGERTLNCVDGINEAGP